MAEIIRRYFSVLMLVALALSSAQGATLTAFPTNVVPVVDLSAEGTLDWAHWGLADTNVFNRRATLAPRIGDVTLLGTSPVAAVTNSARAFNWTNGTPVAVASAANQLVISGADSGFEIAVAADTTTKRLRLHFGLVAVQATLTASLSDNSAPPFTTNLSSTATNLTCVFNYSAASTQQLLRVRVVTAAPLDTNAGILLAAATLARVSSNQPPVVSITGPTNDSSFTAGSDVLVTASAGDNDGAVARVEFFTNAVKIAEATNAPYSFLWTNIPLGLHTLTARARDDEGTNTTSAAVTVFAITNGGAVSYSVSAPTGTVNLTLEGTADWMHWGLITDTTTNRKAGVAPMIGTYTYVGMGPAYQFVDNFNGYTWTDGTPTPGVTNTTTGVSVFGVGNGFEIQAPATSAPRTLRVHVGAYAGRGKLRAFLTDFSAPVVNDIFVNNTGNGPGGIYAITYSAGSPGQKLVVRYTLASRYSSGGNVTLQAASLLSDNNPPTVTLLAPTNGTAVRMGTNFVLSASATDIDGTISRVEFYRNGALVAVSSNAPFTATLSNLALGTYTITARAIDNGDAFAVSAPALLHVITGTGFLRGRMTNPPAAVNLTKEGVIEWDHWGLVTKNDVNRRLGVTPTISELAKIGNGSPQRYADNFSAYSWTNGTPTLTASASRTGIFIYGLSNGFQITVPADTRPQRLNVYAGLYGARSRFEAALSDQSAAPFINNALSRPFNNAYGLYTIDFAAGSSNQVLTVRYIAETLHDVDFGNVTWQAATLQPLQPQLMAHWPPQNGAAFSGEFFGAPGVSYVVEFSDTLAPLSWQPLTNVPGAGSNALFFDSAPAPQRFYRTRAE